MRLRPGSERRGHGNARAATGNSASPLDSTQSRGPGLRSQFGDRLARHLSLGLLAALVAIDAVFVVIHAAHVRYDVPGSGRWLISRDRGHPELYQYLKEAAIVAVLVALASTRRRLLYAAWALFFCYLLIDDAFEVHETVGDVIDERLGLTGVLGIESRDLAQVLFSTSVAAVLFAVVALAYVRDRSEARRLSKTLTVLVVGLAFFGVVSDVIDAIDLFGLVEDGGEMVAISTVVAAVVAHRAAVGAPADGAPPPAGEYHLAVE